MFPRFYNEILSLHVLKFSEITFDYSMGGISELNKPTCI